MTFKSFLHILTLLTICTSAEAQEFVITGSNKIYYGDIDLNRKNSCSVRLSGIIDDAAVSELLDKLRSLPERGLVSFAVLCLDSEGGDYYAAIRVLEYMASDEHTGGILTYVPENAECGSACALIFLTGNGCNTYGCYVARNIHVTAKLWFHSPFANAEGVGLSDETVREIYDAGIGTIRSLVKTLNGFKFDYEGNRISLSLLQNILEHRGTDRFYIETIYDTVRFDIGVVGNLEIPSISASSLASACDYYQISGSEEGKYVRAFEEEQHYEENPGSLTTHPGFIISRTPPLKSFGWDFCDLNSGQTAHTLESLRFSNSDTQLLSLNETISIVRNDLLTLGGLRHRSGAPFSSGVLPFYPLKTKLRDIPLQK